MAHLALVCRYFAHHATYEMWRCLVFDGPNYQQFRMPEKDWCAGVETRLQSVEMLRIRVIECTLGNWVRLISFDYVADTLIIWLGDR
jgi:hypothetical protein